MCVTFDHSGYENVSLVSIYDNVFIQFLQHKAYNILLCHLFAFIPEKMLSGLQSSDYRMFKILYENCATGSKESENLSFIMHFEI